MKRKAIETLRNAIPRQFFASYYSVLVFYLQSPLPKASFEHKKANLGFRGTRLRFHDLDLPFSESKPLRLSIMQRSLIIIHRESYYAEVLSK